MLPKQITVCNKIVKESQCEKVLGLLVNNKLTWWNHLHGDDSDPKHPLPGLVKLLSKRVGMLARLVKLLPIQRFKMLVNGIFMSKLMYCVGVFGSLRGLNTRNETEVRHNSFTKANLRALQTLQNKVVRLMTGHGYDTPVVELFKDCDLLSVNQLIASSTLNSIFKIKLSSEPVYLAERLGFGSEQPNRNGNAAHRNRPDTQINFKLTRGREGMLYCGGKLWNALDDSLKREKSEIRFKKLIKIWVRQNIPLIPD